jgi:hypothetical protein
MSSTEAFSNMAIAAESIRIDLKGLWFADETVYSPTGFDIGM